MPEGSGAILKFPMMLALRTWSALLSADGEFVRVVPLEEVSEVKLAVE